MATTIASTVSDFLNALAGVFFSLLNSVLAVFQAIFVLGKDIFASCLHLVQSFIALALGLLQGVYGFIAGMYHSFLDVFGAILMSRSQPLGRCRPRRRLLLLHSKEPDEDEEANSLIHVPRCFFLGRDAHIPSRIYN